MKNPDKHKISRHNARGKKTRSPGYKPGDHWNICDVCGCAIRNSDSRKTWDGLVVCPDDWDYRHPQDFVRGRKDDTSPKGLVRTEPTNVFITDIVNNTIDNQIPGQTFNNDLEDIIVPDPCGGTGESPTLGEIAWSLTNFNDPGELIDVASASAEAIPSPEDLHFKPDGTKMYVAFNESPSLITQFTLSTPWDVRTATQDPTSFSISTSALWSFYISGDGEKLYVGHNDGVVKLVEYDLSTTWDVATATLVDTYTFPSEETSLPQGIWLSSDGLSLYVADRTGDAEILQYTLTTQCSITDMTLTSRFSVESETPQLTDVIVQPDGGKFFTIHRGGTLPDLYEYTMSTPGDVTTATFTQTVEITTFGLGPGRGLYIGDSGSRAFILTYDATSTNVSQYTL